MPLKRMILILGMWGLAGLQASFFSEILPQSEPNLVLVVPLIAALAGSPKSALEAAFWGGLLLGILRMEPVGWASLVLVGLVWLAVWISGMLGSFVLYRFLILGGSSGIFFLISTRGNVDFQVWFGEFLLEAIIFQALFFPVSRLFRGFEGEERGW